MNASCARENYVLYGDGGKYHNKEQLLENKDKILEMIFHRITNFGDYGKCWEYPVGLDKDGYGRIKIGGKTKKVHRLVYELLNGSIPDGMCVCHSCDNPKCCNPEHLWVGTAADNNRDRDSKGRVAKGDRSGARLHPERLARGDRNGSRLHPDSRPRGDKHFSRIYPEKLARGSDNGMSSLVDADILEILRMHKEKKFTQAEIAKKFGVTQTAISSIVCGKTWSHIDDDYRARKILERIVYGEEHWTKRLPEKLARGDRNGAKLYPEKLCRGDDHWTRKQPEKLAIGDRNGARVHPEKLCRGDDHWSRKDPSKVIRGENHYRSRVLEKQVKEMRQLAKEGWKQKDIARRFHMSLTQTGRILRGESWNEEHLWEWTEDLIEH